MEDSRETNLRRSYEVKVEAGQILPMVIHKACSSTCEPTRFPRSASNTPNPWTIFPLAITLVCQGECEILKPEKQQITEKKRLLKGAFRFFRMLQNTT